MLKHILKIKSKNLLDLNQKYIVQNLEKNKIVIIKNVLPKKKCFIIVKYLSNLISSSIPNFQQIRVGAPNNYRVNFEDKRAIVQGNFHQFSFFPWNQDIFNFYKLFNDIFVFKNRINKLKDHKFFNPKNNKDCTIRLSFQFYPKKNGFLNMHQDPVSYHQKYLMILALSRKGKEFKKGGLFTIIGKNKINLDNYSDYGDLIFFKADLAHGVDKIDPDANYNPLKGNGRWMALFATNKLPKNKKIKDSKDNQKKIIS